jgi:hypothetical protein
MQNSSAFCRAQQAHHQRRAAESVLTNVRQIAKSAAAAWGLEALSAEGREARQIKRQIELGAAGTPTDDRFFSENPDRGFADRF